MMFGQDLSGINLLAIPLVLWIVYEVLVNNPKRTRKEARTKELAEEKEVERQNRDRERNSTPSRRGTETLEREKIVIPIKKQVYPVDVPSAILPNLAPDPTDTRWFLCPHKELPSPSAAESLIIEQLNAYNIEWHREVSFKGLMFTTYSWPRYDFYIPSLRLVLEYDGAQSHSNELQISTDRAKDKFCNDNGITIVRLNRLHYYNMYGHINSLMKQSGIKKKTATS